MMYYVLSKGVHLISLWQCKDIHIKNRYSLEKRDHGGKQEACAWYICVFVFGTQRAFNCKRWAEIWWMHVFLAILFRINHLTSAGKGQSRAATASGLSRVPKFAYFKNIKLWNLTKRSFFSKSYFQSLFRTPIVNWM